ADHPDDVVAVGGVRRGRRRGLAHRLSGSVGRWVGGGQAWAMRSRLPEGSRKAQSRTPQGWSAGSCRTSAPDARSFSKVASRSSVRKMARSEERRVGKEGGAGEGARRKYNMR